MSRYAAVILEDIRRSTLTKGQIRVLRWRLSRAQSPGGHPHLSLHDAEAITEAIEACMPILTQAHTAEGLAYLRRVLFKSNAERRTTKLAQEFTDADCDVVRNFKLFKLVGFAEHGTLYSDQWPVYRATAHNGRCFDYVPRTWQSGRSTYVETHA